ncbi:MAG: hypothetical protein M3N52_12090 [Actinomycetota bacterium]|nr:hypothetical protein [Actinomycetota bacterium]
MNLTSGDAVNGVLIARRGPLLVLADATLLPARGQPQPMDGQTFIERAQVLFIQTAPAKGG